MSIWNQTPAEGPPLTLELLLDTFEKIKNAPPSPCSLGQHVVSPEARYRPGWYPCVNCFQLVHITMPLSEVHVSRPDGS